VIAPDRLTSLDVFRGLTVAAMIVVNNPGTWKAVYAPLRHADWHGWTPTDLVFPFFLFIVGVAIPLALGPRHESSPSARPVVVKIVRRSAIIFALGLVINIIANPSLATVRIPGVLQRIAVCYLAAALLFVWTGWRTQVAVTALALVGYWAAITLIPVPGFGPGDLGKEGNLAAWLDRLVLGGHIWRAGRVYDPEGILSTLPAIATTLLGVLAGERLRLGRPGAAVAREFFLAGLSAAAVGLAWGQWLPINKALWTSSYAVFTAGAALIAFAACYWLVEIRRIRWWTYPFVVLGVNALAAFFLSTLFTLWMLRDMHMGSDGKMHSMYAMFFEGFAPDWMPTATASLVWAVGYAAYWAFILSALQRRGIRLSV